MPEPPLSAAALMQSRKALFDKYDAGAYTTWIQSTDLLIELQNHARQLRDPGEGPRIAATVAGNPATNLTRMLAVTQRAIALIAAECQSICEIAGVPGAVGVRVTLGKSIERTSGSPFDKRWKAAFQAATASVAKAPAPAASNGVAPVRSPTINISSPRPGAVAAAVAKRGKGSLHALSSADTGKLADCTACRNDRATFESLADDDSQYALAACTITDCRGTIHAVCLKQIATLAQAQHCVSLFSPIMCKNCHDEEVQNIINYPTLYLSQSDGIRIVRVNARPVGNILE